MGALGIEWPQTSGVDRSDQSPKCQQRRQQRRRIGTYSGVLQRMKVSVIEVKLDDHERWRMSQSRMTR